MEIYIANSMLMRLFSVFSRFIISPNGYGFVDPNLTFFHDKEKITQNEDPPSAWGRIGFTRRLVFVL